VPHVTEICLFAAAFVAAFTFGPSLTEIVRKALHKAKRRWRGRTCRRPLLQRRTRRGDAMVLAAPLDWARCGERHSNGN